MPFNEFHYSPTGTGVISGKEVLEQTEDAINDLGTQISGDVQTAIDTANNALNVANTASADAQNAVNTANTAYTAATNAQNTANAAQNTASNALTAAQNAQNDVNALGNRVTTAENNITQNTTDISGLTTRMGTAEGNITNLQNDVITAQGTATSAQNTATMARQQAYVLRYSSTAITDNSTIAYSTLDNTDNIKATDKIIDVDGKIFSVVSVDSDNSTVTVGSALIDLALDSNVVHTSGNETVNGEKTFNNLQIIGYGTQYKGARNAYILPEFSAGYSGLVITTLSFAQTIKMGNFVLDSNNKPTLDTSKAYIQIATGENNSVNTCVLEPRNSTDSLLGTSTNKWKQVNGLNPGALFLPQDRTSRLDISAYFTDFTTGSTNRYTVLADGYIFLSITDVVAVHCFSQNTNNLTHYGQTYSRPTVGQIYYLFPVRKDDIFACQWYTTVAAVTLNNAFFVPVKGNV